jgi:hypothetical protein
MPGKCFRGLVTLVYVTGSVLPLAAQQGTAEPPLTPVPVQPAPTEPNQTQPGQGQPSPSQLPRRAPIVPQRPPSSAQQVPGTPGTSDGSVPPVRRRFRQNEGCYRRQARPAAWSR